MRKLQSYLANQWQQGTGEGHLLFNPTTEEGLASASTEGLDLAEAVAFARETGGPGIRAMSFADRAQALQTIASAIHEHREALIELGIANAGNTRGDAKFDIDGATATLTAYASFAKDLPDRPFIPDGEGLQLGRSPRFSGQHIWATRLGVAVHINAFNFPAWGMVEKFACALLAGMPVLEKPGTPTAMVAEEVAKIVVSSGALPEGAFSFLCGSAGDLLDHLAGQDVVAFTGSSETASLLRSHEAFVHRGTRLNVEADSLNATIIGPDLENDSDGFDAFLSDTAREITQKAGQKCTGTRRILVPESMMDEVTEALSAALEAVPVGNPATQGIRMGPLTSASQRDEVKEGILNLATAAQITTGGTDSPEEKGFFISPTLLKAKDAQDDVFHSKEVFGPVSSLLSYSGDIAEAAHLVARGEGSLVSSLYSDDRNFTTGLALALAPWSGRIYLGSSRVAAHGTGPGLVLPSMIHGGPGRAGGGEELGGLRGLQFYMQRCAMQGFKSTIEGSFGQI
ncbi:MAG: 3,4-dehydroadipyl-CoA semialdehyde dehydrogenase [Planctomycetota bacterium]|nr:3,4-dehydroadipyl-CoA semialdehyde dehydrogenase [Planctomycetota bacterium]